jgi:CheY-like chemotaxis protein
MMTQTTPVARPVVLVVEDEPLLRMMAADIVEEAGMQPVEAADADAAIEILERRTDVRILFSDIRMPGSMDGLKLADAVRTRWPAINIILTSGHCTKADIDSRLADLFFPKPYKFGPLEAALQSLAN